MRAAYDAEAREAAGACGCASHGGCRLFRGGEGGGCEKEGDGGGGGRHSAAREEGTDNRAGGKGEGLCAVQWMRWNELASGGIPTFRPMSTTRFRPNFHSRWAYL
jgi:hypothetical protein